MVEEIEEVHRELNPIALLDLPVLSQLSIQICCRGAEAGSMPFHACRGRAEGVSHKREVVDVEDLRALLTRVTSCSSDSQRPVVADVTRADQTGDIAIVIGAVGVDAQ